MKQPALFEEPPEPVVTAEELISAKTMQKSRFYRDRVIRGEMTMEQFARALERHDMGYQGPTNG